MKKTYKNLFGVALGTLLGLSLALPASAQRGGDHSGGDNKSSPPAQQRSAPPAPAQRSAPPPQQQRPASQQQVQRPAPQQQQQQFQRPVQQQRPQNQGQQQNQAMQQNHSFSRPPQQSIPNTTVAPPSRGEQQTFTRATPPSRRYPAISQGTYRPRGYNYPNGGNNYRSYPGLAYGKNHITARPQGFYYRNRGYYATYYRPQLGFSLTVLPTGYYPFYFGQDQYFYDDGLYYMQQDNNYTVVEPPIGATIDKLPTKAQAIAINGMQYYELNGVYYQPITKDDGTLVYEIAGKDGELNTDDGGATASQDDLPQVGDLVDNLPEGCKILKLNGQKYYVSQEGYYFQDAVDTNGDKVFKIVGTPTDEPGN